jgi:hypothetical protein
MLDWEARAFASVPGCSVRPGRTPPVPGDGESPGPVRNRLVIGTVLAVPRVRLRASRNSRRQSRSGSTRAGAAQVLVTGGVVRSVTARWYWRSEGFYGIRFERCQRGHGRRAPSSRTAPASPAGSSPATRSPSRWEQLIPAACMNVASPSISAQSASYVAHSREVSSRGSPPPPSSARISGFVRFRRPESVPPQISPVPANRAAASSREW